jgi:2-dehydro-3-deoxygluconokinase
MAELVTVGETALRLSPPDAERLETADTVTMRASGTESNVAIAGARLGADSLWISKLPDSLLGKRVVAELHEHGIETDVTWDQTHRQGLTFYENADPPREDVLLDDRDDVAAATIEPGELPMKTVQSADAVFTAGSTLALSERARETIQAVFRAASLGMTALDLDYRPGLWSPEEARDAVTDLFDAVDIFIGNEAEIRTVLDRSGQPRELAHTIASEWDFEIVVVTRSEHGAIAWKDNVIHDQDTVETETVDANGQHEAFTGAFLQRLIEGANPSQALSYGVAAAALTRTIPGPLTTITRQEVDRLVTSMAERNEINQSSY